MCVGTSKWAILGPKNGKNGPKYIFPHFCTIKIIPYMGHIVKDKVTHEKISSIGVLEKQIMAKFTQLEH